MEIGLDLEKRRRDHAKLNRRIRGDEWKAAAAGAE